MDVRGENEPGRGALAGQHMRFLQRQRGLSAVGREGRGPRGPDPAGPLCVNVFMFGYSGSLWGYEGSLLCVSLRHTESVKAG